MTQGRNWILYVFIWGGVAAGAATGAATEIGTGTAPVPLSAPTTAPMSASAPTSTSALTSPTGAIEEESRAPDSIPNEVLATGLIEKTFEGTTVVEGTSQARRKITEEATFKVSEEVVQGLLGETRYKKNRAVIVDKIFKQSGRYIPVIKTGDLQKLPEGYKLALTLQVNTKILETLLQEQGLLYDNESAPMILPFVALEDRLRGEVYRWWKTQNPPQLKTWGLFLEQQLQKNLFNMGFYVQRPDFSKMQLLLPHTYQQESLTTEQMQALSLRWEIPLVLVGELVLQKNKINETVLEIRLSVLQVTTGRVLAQLYRQSSSFQQDEFEKVPSLKKISFIMQAYKDLGQQLVEAWQRGVLTSTLVRLEVQGALPLNKYELFKEALKSASRTIRTVRERVVSSESVLFEVEINGAMGDLTAGLSKVTVGSKSYRLKGVDAGNTLVLVPYSSD